jgi:hypothetical protein
MCIVCVVFNQIGKKIERQKSKGDKSILVLVSRCLIKAESGADRMARGSNGHHKKKKKKKKKIHE